MLGMIGALAAIWIALHVLSGGLFLTPRNLWNSVGAVFAGRDHGDRHGAGYRHPQHRSVGRLDARLPRHDHGGRSGRSAAEASRLRQSRRPGSSRSRSDLSLGVLIGALQGFIIAYLGVPSFIVTLGGLLVWRGGAWWVTSGQTIAPLDQRFRLMGGGPEGAIGATWSWWWRCSAAPQSSPCWRTAAPGEDLRLSAAADCGRGFSRRRRLRADRRCGRHRQCLSVAGRQRAALCRTQSHRSAGGRAVIAHGIAVPVLIAIGVGVVMTFLATRTRFGRYVYAIGGNPEAAELAGVNTRWVIMKIFMLMGLLAAIAGAISIARLERGDQFGRHACRAPGDRGRRDRRHVALPAASARSPARCLAPS